MAGRPIRAMLVTLLLFVLLVPVLYRIDGQMEREQEATQPPPAPAPAPARDNETQDAGNVSAQTNATPPARSDEGSTAHRVDPTANETRSTQR